MTEQKRMTDKPIFGDGFLVWTARQKWNWGVWLQNPAGASSNQIARYFREWIAEVEQADGTPQFRWVRLATKRKDGDPEGVYVLVGGLSGGEYKFWLARWQAITGDSDAHAGLLYSSLRHGMRLKPILKDALGGRMFDAVVRVGPRKIRRARTMLTDDEGQPTQKRIELIVRSTFLERERLREAERKKPDQRPERRETRTPQTEKVRYESLFDWGVGKKR
jgi:hypothetical protein